MEDKKDGKLNKLETRPHDSMNPNCIINLALTRRLEIETCREVRPRWQCCVADDWWMMMNRAAMMMFNSFVEFLVMNSTRGNERL